MTNYAIFANALLFAHMQKSELAANAGTAVADALLRMVPGDHIVPLFDSSATHGEAESSAFDAACQNLELDRDQVLSDYSKIAGTVPFTLTVADQPKERTDLAGVASVLKVQISALSSPLSADDFLRLRALDDTVAAQFKGAAPLRLIQEVSGALPRAVQDAVDPNRDESALFRRFSLVAAQNIETARQLLKAAQREPRDGDLAFLVTRAAMPGLVQVDPFGQLKEPQLPIARQPDEIRDLLVDAQRKATPADPFNAEPAIAAADELLGLLSGDHQVLPVDDFAKFYEFRLLSRVITQAIELARRPLPADVQTVATVDESVLDEDMAAALKGLSVEAVLAELPDGFSIQRSVVAACVASLRAGKHLLIGGPPGTGKTTLAEALCRAVVGSNYYVSTATADWTTFDTIGGYLPDSAGLKFVPGVVLRSLRTSGWLIIDEVNRADIDKAFGPLFTVLSGGEGAAGRNSVLPYMSPDGNPVVIQWAATAGSSEYSYAITPSWRLIGTLNLSDKASLFRLSFAFLRRFAVIDVPLPELDSYRKLFDQWFASVKSGTPSDFVNHAMAIVEGPVEIGPAIGRDFAQLIIEGLAETASGEPIFANEREAILIATRLLVAPQYEGEPLSSGQRLLTILDGTLGPKDDPARRALEAALNEVALS